MSGGSRPAFDSPFRCVKLAIAALSIALGVTGCATMKTTLHYRLTVVVDTPHGIRTGSSVVEVKGYLAAFPGMGKSRTHQASRGEATPVALDDGKYLFAVFSWVAPAERTFTMLTVPFKDQLPPRSSDPEEVNMSMMREFRALRDARGIREVEPEDYPVIATFADRMKPYSIRIAPATELSSIMPGYRIVRMSVEITEAPISNEILRILPWLRRGDLGFLNPEIRESQLKPFPQHQTRPFSQYQLLTNDSFIKGITFTKNYKLYKNKDNL